MKKQPLRGFVKMDPSLRELSKTAVQLSRAGHQKGAETLARFALKLSPEDPMILANAGAVLLTTEHAAEARLLTEDAIKREPSIGPKFLHNVGLSLMYSGDLKGAIETFRKCPPETIDAQYDLAVATLLSGDWERGFPMMEIRKKKFDFPTNYPVPEWDGKPIEEGSLWVEAEQGIGDMVQFGRWLPLARERVKRLVFSTHPIVMGLFYGYPGVDEVRLQDENVPVPPDAKAHVALHSLPGLLGATEKNVPPDPGHIAKMARTWPVTVERPPRAAISVGIAWAGNPAHPRDRERTIPFEALLPLFEETGAQFFSIQVGMPKRDATVFQEVAPLVEDLAPQLQNFLRTAAVVSKLDLVITVDTAVAHVAGAVGTPVWTMIAKTPDWRWGLGSDRTVWYPSMRLFRQRRMGDWSHVIASVRSSLANMVDGKVKKLVAKQSEAANEAAVAESEAREAVAAEHQQAVR